MAAKSLLFRPNVAALCLSGSRSFLCRTPSLLIMSTSATTRNLSSSRSLLTRRLPRSSSAFAIRRDFCIRATESSAPIESPLMETMEKKIKEHLSADSVVVKDAYGDGRHVSIEVISSAFEGQSAVNRQRMVYKAIWEELQDRVHAVDQMSTRTPSEAAAGK
ncbi:protein BOLA4, chloroplastic/mitochondrial-like [Salvia miltiorrhiza]|uniref:protein BOLA4, chloroplastic/mitochondrial-like n=1 Tax=Salvia miltiorrhiza TaxID=226208 RepID=UPI0025AD3DA1|nr:protein BOLA4, chloroplastic/mitochondrial-like [Salvia miltiorrhiza]